MLRRNQLIGTAVLALACSLPAPAAMSQVDLRNPDSRQATPPPSFDEGYRDLRNPDSRQAPGGVEEPAPVIEVREVPSSGFSWADAGIGAAGMLGLFSLAAGSLLLVTNRRRRRGWQATAH